MPQASSAYLSSVGSSSLLPFLPEVDVRDCLLHHFFFQFDMAGGRVAHVTLKGPSVVKELVIATALGLAAGTLWKMHHWNEQRKVRAFYDMLDKGQISVVAEE